jgi:hypothetical protein
MKHLCSPFDQIHSNFKWQISGEEIKVLYFECFIFPLNLWRIKHAQDLWSSFIEVHQGNIEKIIFKKRKQIKTDK